MSLSTFKSIDQKMLQDALGTLKELLKIDSKDIDALLADIDYTGGLTPIKFRQVHAALQKTNIEDLILLQGIVAKRGYRIGAYASKNDKSGTRIQSVITNLEIKVIVQGKSTSGYTIGKVLSAYPEIGVRVRMVVGNSSLDGIEYPGKLPAHYQISSGVSVMPFDESIALQKSSNIALYLDWLAWYVDCRSALTYQRTGQKPMSKDELSKKRTRQMTYIDLQAKSRWDKALRDEIWATLSDPQKNELKATTYSFDYASGAASPSAIAWIATYKQQKGIDLKLPGQ